MQEEMDQRAHVVATHVIPPPTAIPTTVENLVPPQGNISVHIPVSASGGVPPSVINPPIIEVDDQQDAFSSPKAASVYNAFGPPTNEVEKKVWVIEYNLKAMEGSDALGLDVAEMCLVLGVVIPAKFKVPDLEKYKGASDPRTYIIAYCQKMVVRPQFCP